MRINHNISSMITQGSLFRADRAMGKTIQRLSTGLRINSAADDAAGLGVSENLRTQVRGMGQALKNSQDVIAMLKIADGALQEQTAILQRMRELVIQAKNETYTQVERGYMGEEFKQLVTELDRIAAVTNYNGIQLFATPEASGDLLGVGVYNVVPNEFETPKRLRDQTTIFNGDYASVFGPGDYSSSHHMNMMVGQNFSTADAAAYNGVGRYSYDPTASNLLTIQFGQMDASGLLSLYPRNIDGSELFDGFDWDPSTSMADYLDGGEDLQDTLIDYGSDGVMWNQSGASGYTNKLQLFLQILDGGAEVSSTMRRRLFTEPAARYNNDSMRNVTGLKRVNTMRGYIGSMINRLEHSVSNLTNQMANSQAAESVIRDADFAAEASALTTTQILQNSSTAMLSQANLRPQNVLQLLQF